MSNEPVFIKGCKILVVDDKKENLELMTNILEKEGYDVSFAMDGEKAIRIASLYQPDLILLDVMMPGIDGFETCRRMKSLTDLRDIPIIFVTGRVEVSDIVQAFSIGAVDYVTKPIRHEELCARVMTHIQLRKLMTIRDDLITQLRNQHVDMERLAMIKEEQIERTEKLSHLGELVGELTHELSTPLGISNTAISSLSDKNSQLVLELVDGKLSKNSLQSYLEVSAESFDIVLSSVNYACQLVDSFKQIVVGEFSEAVTDYELKFFLQSIIHIMTPRIKRSKQTIEITCPAELIVTGQAGALSQVIINLINNALIHAFAPNEEGFINIDATLIDDHVTITVKDSGRGMDYDKTTKVFDKYFTTRMGKGGSGLGLFIVKNLVTEQLKGSIRCDSEVGRGSRFMIAFPMRS
ncbi:MAG: two-component system NtrC family sensor kinase [Phenylobacterium sp.]|jgi:two-component system NtrC family sensor kinase